jgi:hypothetical protein
VSRRVARVERDPTPGEPPRHLLICRHASGDVAGLLPKGRGEIKAVAERLASAVEELPENARPCTWQVCSADSRIAKGTAEVVLGCLAGLAKSSARTITLDERAVAMTSVATHPIAWSPYGGAEAISQLDAVEDSIESDALLADATVIVLHDPQAAWLVRRLSGRDVPLGHGGCAWLVRHPTWRSRLRERLKLPPRFWRVWATIDNEPPALLQDARSKVEVKYKTAGALGAFLTAVLLFLGERLSDRLGDVDSMGRTDASDIEVALWAVALVAVGLAALMNFAALFEYDRLLMPVRFWAARLPGKGWTAALGRWRASRGSAATRGAADVVARPPAGSARVTIESAQRIWRRLVVTSGAAFAVGLIAFGGAVVRPDHPSDLAWLGLGLGILLAAGAVYIWARAPLGTSD